MNTTFLHKYLNINILPKNILPLLILLAVYIVYGEFIWNPIIFDDQVLFQIGLEGFKAYHINIFDIRAIPYASIIWTAKYFGLEITNFRIASLFLHGAVGVALFYFLNTLYSLTWKASPYSQQNPNSLQWIAFFSALIFVWHPIAVYGAAYLIQRTIVMSTLFSLMALNTYLLGITSNRKYYLFISIAFYGLAVLSKEHAIMLPMVMISLSILYKNISNISTRFLLKIFLAYFLIASYVIFTKIGIVGQVYEFSTSEMLASGQINHPYAVSILTQSWLFFKYLILWILPNPAWLSIDMRQPLASIISLYWLSLFAYILYGVLMVWLLFKGGKSGLFGFSLLFPWLLFMTEFSSVRIQEPFVLYRSYLWITGLFGVIPLLVLKLRFRYMVIVLSSIAIVFAAGATDRLLTFATPIVLWQDAANLLNGRLDLLGTDRIYYNLGNQKMNFKRYRDALEDYNTAIKLNPIVPLFHYGAGNAYYGLGDFKSAVNEYSKSLQLNVNGLNIYHWRGMCNKILGLKTEAKDDFYISCKLGYNQSCIELTK